MSETATLATAMARSVRLPVLKNRQTRAIVVAVAEVAVSDMASDSVSVTLFYENQKQHFHLYLMVDRPLAVRFCETE